jgi:hypothetical protein
MSAIFKNLPGRWPAGHRTPEPALPRVIGTVSALMNLPHMTIVRVQTGAAAQIINDGEAHYLSYAGTDLVDYLDPDSLKWDRESLDSLRRMLPAVIIDQP